MNQQKVSDQPLILLGAGGHAKVLLSAARAANMNVTGVCDPVLAKQGLSHWRGLPVIGNDDELSRYNPESVALINGVGHLPRSCNRQSLFERFKEMGFSFPPIKHPTAWLDASVQISEGVQIMAGVIVQADSLIGPNSIINTGAHVDHDCAIGAHVHIAPGATLCGNVAVKNQAFIGAGATLIQGITISEKTIIGAGITVTHDQSQGQLPQARTGQQMPAR